VTDVMVIAHHIVPIWDGGGNAMSNLVTLCDSCHKHRHVVLSAERRAGRRREFRWDPQMVAMAILTLIMVLWFIAYVIASA